MQQSIFVSAASKLRINHFERGGGWFVLPFFVLFLVFGVFGLLFTLVVSFHRWDPINGTGQLIFRGWRGYYFVLTDQGFWQSLQQSLGRALPEILIQHLLAFPLAFALYLVITRLGI